MARDNIFQSLLDSLEIRRVLLKEKCENSYFIELLIYKVSGILDAKEGLFFKLLIVLYKYTANSYVFGQRCEVSGV